ncbi:MAG: hypothetical protein LC637_11260, partial [Xanthomonadaceae bacterium]|nr:hypothetical protein [Xanthomonadaceae bacterium]
PNNHGAFRRKSAGIYATDGFILARHSGRRGRTRQSAPALNILNEGQYVDLVLHRWKGVLLDQVTVAVRIIDLQADRVRQRFLPAPTLAKLPRFA